MEIYSLRRVTEKQKTQRMKVLRIHISEELYRFQHQEKIKNL
jgi:hypothetical protein